MSKYLKNTQKCIHLIPSLPLLFSFSWLITMFANKRSLCVKTMGLLQEVFSFSSSISTSAAQVILNEWCNYELTQKTKAHSNLAIRNGLVRNKLVLRNHFLWPICHLLHKDKELLALNNFRATKKFLIAKFDCITKSSDSFTNLLSEFSINDFLRTFVMISIFFSTGKLREKAFFGPFSYYFIISWAIIIILT